jgi:ABC-2 type transport system permease protein
MSDARRGDGFWHRTLAMLMKEFIQLRRDRMSFGMIIMVPLLQLMLFGYAINTTPHNLPTAVLVQEESDVGRTILKALENTAYFKIVRVVSSEAEFDQLLKTGTVLFVIEIPRGFERALRRGDRPAILVAADATDPIASSAAMSALSQVAQTALRNDRALPDTAAPLFDIRAHARYNPAGSSQLNIVPGLTGTILTMTMLMFTALSVTRESERGTMELLAMPIEPVEIMLGRMAPYVVIGFIQATLIITFGRLVFEVPITGSIWLFAMLSTLFIGTNLSIGYTFSTIAQNQLQAVQMTFMFFLPNILLSGHSRRSPAGRKRWASSCPSRTTFALCAGSC